MQNLQNITQSSFESIKMMDETWFEFWSARELMKVLWYVKWDKFEIVIEKAQEACRVAWNSVEDHFPGSGKMIDLWKWWQRKVKDYLLSRYACYLIAQNGDSRKPEIAFAQTYFATQTRKQEIYEQNIKEEKRLQAREKLKISEDKIEWTIYTRGISTSIEFASFKDKNIRALYNMSTNSLKAKRWISKNRALADFDSELELNAKNFIYSMTEHNIREKNLVWKPNLENELVANSKATRNTMLDRWIVPENLKKEEDLKLVKKRKKTKLISGKKLKIS
jgi:DNA-damage-inducible protein D